MKAVLLLLGALGSASAAGYCYYDVNLSCGPTSSGLDLPSCNALYGAFRRFERYGLEVDFSKIVISEMQTYANLHIERSYEFLLSSAFFNNYQTNRDGFTKLFRKMSDAAWEDAIGLIKHITKRGHDMDFAQVRTRHGPGMHRNITVEHHELGALATALDVHKELAERAFHIHREATRNRDALHDAEIAQYLEEKFVEKQADTIRNLAGHTSDVKGFINDRGGQDVSMSLYLFDKYLTKVV